MLEDVPLVVRQTEFVVVWAQGKFSRVIERDVDSRLHGLLGPRI
jgi:hypothetical protein